MSERSTPTHVDSVSKLLERLAVISKEPIVRDGHQIKEPPTQIYLSPSLLRAFMCKVGCTACCLPFTLDFTPDEFAQFFRKWPKDARRIARQSELFRERHILINARQHVVVTCDQYKSPKCPFLLPVREGGNLGCGFFPAQPLECAAAPQLTMTTRGPRNSVLMKRPFGRAWAWNDTPQCEFDPILDTIEQIPGASGRSLLANEISLLLRYKHWADYFGIATHIPAIIDAMTILPDTLRQRGIKLISVL